jgi:hypothetical protein
MEASKRRSPDSAPHTDRATNQKQQRQFTAIVREIVGMLLAAAIFSATVWQSVFGMVDIDQPEASIMLAEVEHGHR